MGDEEGEDGPEYKLYEPGQDKPREQGSQGFSGQGKAEYKNGDTYDGCFEEGKRKGKGKYMFSKNGDVYEGFYEDNMKSGFGKLVYGNKKGEDEEGGDEAEEEEGAAKIGRGGTYLGVFSNGQRGCKDDQDPNQASSEGTFSYVNGDVYVGQWKAGKKHGKGSYTFAKDDTKLVGEWENGKITNGRWIFPSGTFYCGSFRYNKPNGKGVWVFANGNQLTGEYNQKEQANEEEPPEDPENPEPKPDPEVTCTFKCGKNVLVQGGTMFGKTAGS